MQKPTDRDKGHRKRLREKFIKLGLSGFHNYEIVELLLTLGTPRKDCKPQAKEAIKKFKSLKAILEAPLEELQEIEGIGPHNIFGIKLFQEIAERYLKERIIGKEIQLKSSKEVYDYLFQSMQKEKREIFKVMFLDAKNSLIEAKDLFEGSLTSSVVYPREIVKKAIKYNAVSLIFVHNHPSGDPEPSPSDKNITEELVFAVRFILLVMVFINMLTCVYVLRWKQHYAWYFSQPIKLSLNGGLKGMNGTEKN